MTKSRFCAFAATLVFTVPWASVCLAEDPSRPSNSPDSPAKSSISPLNLDTRLSIDPADRIAYADATPATATANGNEAELAKKLQNPIADLISVPFELNYNEPIGPKKAARYTLNIQPVIPFSLNSDWNLITRTIFPLVYKESSADGQGYKFGTGDTLQSFFFSPKVPVNGWIVGAGPVFQWPTASDDSLGAGQWGAGPTAVVVKQESGWTYGMLANHIWSYVGPRGRQDVNATFLQPFISYTFPTFTTIGMNTESTYDWTNHQWTVPINVNVSQLLKIGGQPVSFKLGGGYYAEGPSGGPEWNARFTVTFLFPK